MRPRNNARAVIETSDPDLTLGWAKITLPHRHGDTRSPSPTVADKEETYTSVDAKLVITTKRNFPPSKTFLHRLSGGAGTWTPDTQVVRVTTFPVRGRGLL